MELPTLEQFLEQNLSKKNKYGTYDGVSKDEILLFTRLYVQDALKVAAEKAQWKQESEETSFGADKSRYDFMDTDYAGDPCTGYIISINKESILNAYPLTNIK